MFFYFVVNREVLLGLHALRNAALIMGMLVEGNHDDLHKSGVHESGESHNRCEQDKEIFFALLKTFSGNQETLALFPIWLSNHLDHHKSTILMNAIASSEIAFEFVSLKFQVHFF